MSLGDLARLGALTTEQARAIRARLVSTGFVERKPAPSELHEATGVPEELRAPLVKWALERDASPAAGLALLFQHLAAIPRDRADRALGVECRGALERAGILEERAGMVASRFVLVAVSDVFVWSDDARGGSEAVMTPGPTSLDLISTLPSPISGSVLDVGTGPGTMALIAAHRGADRVVATDISERAAALASFNAAFNEIAIEVRVGDLYAPVQGQRFDWIVAQPPYVTHPEDEPGVTFLHGGAMGDEIAVRLLEGVATHLRRPAVATFLFDSPVRDDETLGDRVRHLVPADLDVAVLAQPGLGPDRQALGYAALADPTFGERYAQAAVRYRAHLARQRIAAVTHALVVVRAADTKRREGWTVALPVARVPDGWDELRELMRGIDLAQAGDDAIAASRVRPREGASIVLERKPGAARDDEARSIRFTPPGLALDRELTQAGAVIFDLLAAERSVASTIDQFASAMERSPADVRPLVTSFVRDCLMRALLVPD